MRLSRLMYLLCSFWCLQTMWHFSSVKIKGWRVWPCSHPGVCYVLSVELKWLLASQHASRSCFDVSASPAYRSVKLCISAFTFISAAELVWLASSPAYEDTATCGAEEDTMLNGLVLAGCIVLVRGCLCSELLLRKLLLLRELSTSCFSMAVEQESDQNPSATTRSNGLGIKTAPICWEWYSILADLQTQLCCMVNYICHKLRITKKWCVFTLLNINNFYLLTGNLILQWLIALAWSSFKVPSGC